MNGMTAMTLEDLDAWTVYDLRIAAENGAGVGPYGTESSKTLQVG